MNEQHIMIAVFIWPEITGIGGVSTWILQCLRSLPKLGVDAYVLDVIETQQMQLNLDGIEDHIIHVSPRKQWEGEALFQRRLGRVVRKIGADLLVFNEQVHAEDFLEATRFRISAVNVVHSDRDAAYSILEELIRCRVPQLCVSRTIADKLSVRLSESEQSLVHSVLLGIDIPEKIETFPFHMGDSLRLAYVGRLSCYQKSILEVIPFLQTLRLHGVNFYMDIVGDGPDRETLCDQLTRFDLNDCATLHGAVSHEAALNVLAQTHIFLMFSTFEGLPLTLLEAMARGAVPVVTDLDSGISEVVHDRVNGRVFPVGQPDVAAKIVEELSNNVKVFESLRLKAVETSLNYSFSKQIEWFAEFFRKQESCRPLRVDADRRCSWKDKIRHWLPM